MLWFCLLNFLFKSVLIKLVFPAAFDPVKTNLRTLTGIVSRSFLALFRFFLSIFSFTCLSLIGLSCCVKKKTKLLGPIGTSSYAVTLATSVVTGILLCDLTGVSLCFAIIFCMSFSNACKIYVM